MGDEGHHFATLRGLQVGKVVHQEPLGERADDGESGNLAHEHRNRIGLVASLAVRPVVVIPTFNERENIVDLLRVLRARVPEAHLMVVDDLSPDGTGELADAAAAELGEVTVVHREGRPGLGAAYRHGFALAFAEGFDVVVSMDSDFSHDPAVIPTMLGLIEGGADVVIGSRYVAGGGTQDWPMRRRLLSRWGNRYTGWLLGAKVRDCTAGFRAYRADVLQRIDPASTAAEGYAFLTELTRRLARSGANIVETPILFKDREKGTSKMSARIIVESMLLVTGWGILDRWRDLRQRFTKG
ncbi:MAG: polyprenol monophosphomannose synthase [Actinobacteria bacterium]|nr:polyprenol monophosphomannose synthase [Actinomycetota bacterium]